MSPPGNLDDLSPAELKALVIRLMGEITELQRVIEGQRAEIARLKGLKGRPRLKPSKPSGMEEASLSKPPHPRRRGRGHQTRVAVEEEMIPVAVPAGSRFKRYQDYVVTELEIRPRVLLYRRARWLPPDGCCAPGSRARRGLRSTTPGRATRRGTASARKSVTTASPGLARRHPRAAATFSNCCAPAMTTM